MRIYLVGKTSVCVLEAIVNLVLSTVRHLGLSNKIMAHSYITDSHITLAVLMTCHNRRDITLSCLEALQKQANLSAVDLCVYLVDDGSSDGTSEAVKASYPSVKILHGDGSLFWVGGMRLAFAEALKSSHDYYIWLNDDTLLEPDAFSTLIETHQSLMQQGYPNSIVASSVRDIDSGELTYGGRVKSSKHFYHKFRSIEPGNEPKKCDTMQGNCVLIPQSVAAKVGNLDKAFIHTMGDIDYGLRASKLGCSVWIAPGYLGNCSQNSVRGNWADTEISLIQRLRKVIQPKAFPIKPWTVFARRHKGKFWFVYWILPYLRAVVGYRKLSASPSFRENT